MPTEKSLPKRHELLSFVQAVVSDNLAMYGLEGEAADQLGSAVADRLAREWGGQVVSFPKDAQRRRSLRDVEIYSKFTGRNYRALAAEYGLCVRAVYDVIERARGCDQGEEQLFLDFGSPE